ncbi:hypothetical protein GMORB2_3495 [Geosmithia morbida]|uniref:Uncharacterized protein n=1 Tax=Geosmithia morbida TaxID=1094350 RepID=A0A9P4YQU2_9HYPO|nr:uncharacterized protein GMORB2_3495 [Geosmithia morbida]KAF4120084.1 hypothetical protein GMORB2_3495 [Geosmithia morbida]
MVRLCWAIAAVGLFTRASSAEISCFAPDGKTLADNETYVPCNKLGIQQDGIESSCCRLDGKADERDLCAATGLCLNGGVLFRGYCTDKTWKNPACVDVCTDPKKHGSSNGSVEITPCTDGKYCCGSNNLACCGTDEAFEIPTMADKSTETANRAASATRYKNSTIGLAVALGIVAFAAAAAVLWLTRKNRRLSDGLASGAVPTASPVDEQQSPAQHNGSIYDPHSPTTGTQMTSVSPAPLPHSSGDSKVVTDRAYDQRYSELDGTSLSPPYERSAASPPLHPSDFRLPEQHSVAGNHVS